MSFVPFPGFVDTFYEWGQWSLFALFFSAATAGFELCEYADNRLIAALLYLFIQQGAIHESPVVSRHVERSRQAQSKHQGVAAYYIFSLALDPSANAQDDR